MVIDELSIITNLAQRQVQIEKEVADLESKLKEKKKVLVGLSEKDLPEAMVSADLENFKLHDGTKVTIKEIYQASITEEKRPAVCAWLKKHNLDALMTNDLTIKFMKGQEGWLKKFLAQAKRRKKPLNMALKENINTGTFKATVKRMDDDGEIDVPLEDIGIRKFKKSEVKVPSDQRA